MRLVRLLVLGCAALLARPVAAQNTALDPTFQRPVILNGTGSGTVYDVVQQPDGKYVIGGTFTSINGTPASNLARLNADGTLDAGFTTRSTANGPVYALALQPDGSVLVGGQFDVLATGQRRSVGRLLATGLLDAGFDVGLPAVLNVRQVAPLPGGDVLMLEPKVMNVYGEPVVGLYRLNGQTGQIYNSFQQAVMVSCFAVQPDGKIVTGGSGTPYNTVHKVARLLPTGQLDPTFPALTTTGVFTSRVAVAPSGSVYYLANSPNGYTYSGISWSVSSSVSPYYWYNYNTWGSLRHAEFALQPNGRVLVAGANVAGAPLSTRVLTSGWPDNSYAAANGPVADASGNGQLLRLLVQPNGVVMMAGSFTQAGTTPVYGLVRMLDANVLPTRGASLAAAATAAWPVPAADVLHVQLATAVSPQQLTLLDQLGRPVLARAVAVGATTLELDVAALPAGVYVLRVSYGTEAAPVTRAVVLAR